MYEIDDDNPEYQDLMELLDEGNQELDAKGEYLSEFSVAVNGIGTIDCDSVKGCIGNCYAGDCYALRSAQRFGWDFHKPKIRYFKDGERDKFIRQLQKAGKDSGRKFARIGVMGDPSLSWSNTVRVAGIINDAGLVPVVITKWRRIPNDGQLRQLKDLGAIIHSSICVLDGPVVTKRFAQGLRFKRMGGKSLMRLITYETGKKSDGSIQDRFLQTKSLSNLETPLRMAKSNPLVQSGRVLNPNKPVELTKHICGKGGMDCYKCKEQCGVDWSFNGKGDQQDDDIARTYDVIFIRELLKEWPDEMTEDEFLSHWHRGTLEEQDVNQPDKGRFSLIKIKWEKKNRDEYHIFLSKKGLDKVDDIILSGDPLEFKKLAALRADPKDKKYMNFEGQLPNNSDLNPDKETPAYMEHLENGFYEVLEEDGDTMTIEFNKNKGGGVNLSGTWNFYRTRPKTNLWVFKKV